MSRRTLTLAVLTIMTYVVAACAQPTAPRGADTTCSRTGWGGGSGKSC